MQCDSFISVILFILAYGCPFHFGPYYAHVLLMLEGTNLKYDFRIHKECHCFISLDRNEAWEGNNFNTYWKWKVFMKCLAENQIFP